MSSQNRPLRDIFPTILALLGVDHGQNTPPEDQAKAVKTSCASVMVSYIRQHGMTAYYTVSMSFLFLISAKVILTTNEDSKYILKNVTLNVGAIYFFSISVISAIHGPGLKTLIDNSLQGDSSWRKTVKQTLINGQQLEGAVSPNWARSLNQMVATYNIVGYLFVMLIPVLNVITKAETKGGELSLAYDSWFPIDDSTTSGYLIAYFFQVFATGPIQILIYSTMAMPIMVLCLFLNQFAELRAVLKNLGNKSCIDYPTVWNGRIKARSPFDELLKHCVIRHHAIIQDFKLYKKWFDPLISVEFMYYVLEFLVLGNTMIAYSNIGFRIRAIIMMANITFCLYIHCYIGDIFSTMPKTEDE